MILRGVKVGFNTNKTYKFAIECTSKHFYDFDVRTFGSFNDRPLKPDPNGFFEIVKKLDLVSKNCFSYESRR